MRTLQLAYPLLCISNLYLHLKVSNQDTINETIDETLSKIMMMMKTNFVSKSTERKIEEYFQQETSNEELYDEDKKIEAVEKEFERDEKHEEEKSGLNRYGYDVETSLLDEQIQSIGKHSERKVSTNIKPKSGKRKTKNGFLPEGSSVDVTDVSSFLYASTSGDNENSDTTNTPSSSLPSQYPVVSSYPSSEYPSESPEIPTVSLSPSSSTSLVPSSNNVDSSTATDKALIETEDLSTRRNSLQRNIRNNDNFILQSLEQIVASIMVSLFGGLPFENPVETVTEILPDTDELDLPNVDTVTEILPDIDEINLPNVDTVTEILPDTDGINLPNVETVTEILPETDEINLPNVDTVTEILPDTDELDLPDIGSNNNFIIQGLQKIITSIMDSLFNDCENEIEPSASPSYQSSTSADIDLSSDSVGSDVFIDDFFLEDDSLKGQDSSITDDSSLPVSSSGSDELLTSNGSLDQPPVSEYNIWLDEQSWSGTMWLDKSTNGHHSDSARGTINTELDLEIGIRYLYGDTNSGVTLRSGWPSGSEYTLFHVTKYNGTTKGRIWNGITGNWASGHRAAKRGVFNHGLNDDDQGWVSDFGNNYGVNIGDVDSWGIFTDRVNSSGSNVRVDRVDVTHDSSPYYNPDGIGINPVETEYDFPSDWAAGMVLVYDRYLTDDEVESVEDWIYTKYLPVSCGLCEPVAQVDFSEGENCPTCAPYSLHDGAEIKTGPGGIQALRIDSDGPYAKIPGVDISPSNMPGCTLTIGVYLESIPIDARGWIFGHENSNYDRTIILHDPRYSENNEQNVIASGTGEIWRPWTNGNLQTGTAPIKEWFHVTAVFRQDGECSVYVNGVKSDHMTIGKNDNGQPDLYVGRPGTFVGDDNLWADAWIKEVKVFNGALFDIQVQWESVKFFGSLDQPPVSEYNIWLDEQSWSGTMWLDKSTNGHHSDSARGTINTAVDVESGMKYLYGGTTSGVTLRSGWPSGSEYTLFHVTKYNGSNKGRIWNGISGDWASGHRASKRGVFNHGNWVSDFGDNYGVNIGDVDSWGIFTDRVNSSGSNVRVDQVDVTYDSSPNYNPDGIGINPVETEKNFPSDWAAGMVLVYDRYLTDDEVESVEDWIYTKYRTRISNQPSMTPSLMPSNLSIESFARVDFSEGENCPTCAPYSLHDGAEIKTGPGGIQALRIDSDGPYAKIPGIDISPSEMPDCTLTIGVYLESIPINAEGWIFGHDNGGMDRTIVLHDKTITETNTIITSTTGEIWSPWANNNLGTSTAPIKKWFHVTAVFRQGGDCFVYVNGKKSDKTTTGMNTDGLPDLYVGRPGTFWGNYWADAWIKEVKVFDIALADAQVQYESDTFFGITRTDTVGGSGGVPFDDKHAPWEFGMIKEIEIYFSNQINYIRITYANDQSFSHGMAYGQQRTITLDEHEYIVGISVRSDDDGVHEITFQTNYNVKHGPFGIDNEGKSLIDIDFDENALLHIFGLTNAEGGQILQLGFAYISSSSLPSSMPSLMTSLSPSSQPSVQPSSLPSSRPSNLIAETFAQVDFSQGDDCPTCTPYSLEGEAQIMTAPGGTQALRINSDGKFAKIPGIDISPSNMPDCTLTTVLYLESIPEDIHGWIFGHDKGQGGMDRTIILHDSRDWTEGKNVVTSLVGVQDGWMPWVNEERGTPPIKQWFHVTAVFRQGGECAVYLNGVKSDYTTIGENGDGYPDLYVGRPGKSDLINSWSNAWIKEVKVFDIALADGQVQYESDTFFGITRTDTVGGSGGIPFDDKHAPWEFGMIKEIEIYASSFVNSIRITYANDQSFSHGTEYGQQNIITLDEHEYIVGISVRFNNDYIHEITFKKNDGSKPGPFGSNIEGSQFLEIDFGGNALLHIFGLTKSEGGDLFQLGFAYISSSSLPSSIPSLMPSVIPSSQPSEIPSVQPSNQPSITPTEIPSSIPSLMPSVIPSSQPSEIPSVQPSNQPSSKPSISPSSIPSAMPSAIPSTYPSVQPTVRPSEIPTEFPSEIPSVYPTILPSKELSYSPSIYPSVSPSDQPSKIPSIHPSALPSKSPSIYPTVFPSDQPSRSPSVFPSVFPSDQPSKNPSIYPSIFPSDQPSKSPSIFPSVFPSYQPSKSPSVYPSTFPSDQPTDTPSIFPSVFSSIFPSVVPSNKPSVFPSATPSFQPTPKPTVFVDISQAPSDESQKIPDFETTCVLLKTEVSICEDDPTYSCSMFASQGYCNHIDYYQNMNERCQKSCDKCPPPRSSDFSHEKMQHNSEDFVTEFNLDMIINTDANSQETSWIFLSESPKVTVVRSNESDATSELFDNTLHQLNFSCVVSYIGKEKMNPNTTEPLCYTLEVHDSDGDGMCCDNGSGSFGISINNTKNETLSISNPFYDGSKMELSFCIDKDGKIESETEAIDVNVNQPTYFPLRRMQCKKRTSCHCDTKPNLFTDIRNDDVLYDTKDQTLLGISTLSQPKQLQDVESPQYKAACWVLFDDPYQYVSKEMNTGTKRRMLQQYRVTPDLFIEEGTQKRMMQRYAMAVLYFSTEPHKWKKHLQFLSSRSECEWKSKESNSNGITSIQGSLCDSDSNIISLYLTNNNLNGKIVEELSELKSLEVLDLSKNNIHGSMPPELGQLSKLRELHLSQNALEGAIHPNIFNADNLEKIELEENKISETIPDTIENLRRLSSLNLNLNNLSGSIPDAIYSLKSLQNLNLGSNQFSSSISPLIGNLKKLKKLYLSGNILNGKIPSRVGELKGLQELTLGNNTLSGSIPSTVGELTSLSKLALDENQLTGEIPESLFNLPLLRDLKLQENAVRGSIPDQLCENDDLDLQADCQNDVFEPQVSCSCCSVCSDKTPIWDGECADATIKIEIDRKTVDHDEYSYSSDGLEWSLVNAATEKKIPLSTQDDMGGGTACVAFTDCISIVMLSQPIFDTYIQIYWNNTQVGNGIRKFPGLLEPESTYEYINKPFQFDEENQELITCRETELLTCHDGNEKKKLIFDPKSPMHISFSKVTSLFGRQNILNSSSVQSKALCWVLQKEDSNDKLGLTDTEISERFVLTTLHLKTQNGLFGEDEYPPELHECEWPGIQCTRNNNTRLVTGISLTSEHNQIINGTLIEELGGLQYLEILEFNQTQLEGTIPKSFSNLWSLKNLNLSGNSISGTLPSTLFKQLNNLEYIDLSSNRISGLINDDIGSISSIRLLDLSKNQFTGSFPLAGFKYNDLEYLDVSGNELNSVEFHHLIKHTNLKSLDLSFNFFVGSLHEDTFTSLAELEYLNISQNDFSGCIPSTFPELSNITHFDMHENRFKGVIPVGITDLSYIKYINLQGNKLTGSLPSQINQLKNLKTLILSHNEIKGTIPFDPTNLSNITKLHLHGNNLVGKAPPFSNMTSYITDCGFPAASLKPISCSTCDKCCNSDGNCQEKRTKELTQVDLTVIFLCIIIGFLSICYMMKHYITHIKFLETYFCERVGLWNAMTLISDKSVYHFLLAKNKLLWFLAVFCVVFQGATLFLFVQSADLANETSDREYTMTCPANSLDCENSNKVSSYGKFVFGLILTIWLLKDIIGSIKLMLVSFQHKNIDFFFAGASVFTVTMLSLWSSIIYIIAIAVKNTDLIKDAVVLLFVIEIDERIYELVENINPEWVDDIEKDMRNSLVYLGNDLVISSVIAGVSTSMKRVRRKILRNFRRIIHTLSRRSRRRNRNDGVAVSSEAVAEVAPELRP